MALVAVAVTRDPTWNDLAPVGDELAEEPAVLVIDLDLFMGTEAAYFPAATHHMPWPVVSFITSLAI